EEHEWRNSHTTALSAPGWLPPRCAPPRDIPNSALDAPSIATIYRDLRKGREANKDEPGAADFYYGEMEMRRLTGSAPNRKESPLARVVHPLRVHGKLTRDRGEHLILTLYWLTSGYGLRASRALVSLFLTVLIFAALLYGWGFSKQHSFSSSLTFSFQ